MNDFVALQLPFLLSITIVIGTLVFAILGWLETWQILRLAWGTLLLVVVALGFDEFDTTVPLVGLTAWAAAVWAIICVMAFGLPLLRKKLHKRSASAPPHVYEPSLAVVSGSPSPPVLSADGVSFFDQHIIQVHGEIDAYSSRNFANACSEVLREPKSTLVQVHTQGGRTGFGRAMGEQIKLMASLTEVRVLAVGDCMSAGMQLLCALPLEFRWATSGSIFMIHANSATDNKGESVPYEQLPLDSQKAVSFEDELLIETLCAATSIDRDSLVTLIKSGRSYHFNAQRAIELGLITGIVNS